MIGGFSPWFSEELQRRVAAQIAQDAGLLIKGAGGVNSFADYRYVVGFADGMQRALDIADEIRAEQEKA